MKLYLLVLALIISHCTAFRLLSRDRLSLPQLPNSIFFLKPNLLVAQTGSTIQLYNTTSKTVVETFTSDSADPQVQIAPDSNMILFKNNKSIFQIQKNKQDLSVEVDVSQTFYVFSPGTASNRIISHQLSSKGKIRYVSYINTDTNQVTKLTYQNNSESILFGSRVVAFSPQEYYFFSGGIVNPQQNFAEFFLFRGDSKDIQNMYSLKVPGFVNAIIPGQRQQWRFSSADLGGSNRLHILTYTLDQEEEPRLFTTSVLTSSNSFTSLTTQFDTRRLIGVDFIDQTLYTADDLLCRVIEHSPENYDGAIKDKSIFNFTVAKTIVSDDEALVLALTDTVEAYIFAVSQRGTYDLLQKITNPLGPIIKAQFFNSTLIIIQNAQFQVSIYDFEAKLWSTPATPLFVDYCVSSNNLIFAITVTSQGSDLYAGRIVRNETDLTIIVTAQQLSITAADVVCLDTSSVLVNPTTAGQPIAIWKYTNAFSNTANLIKLAKKHNQAYKSSNFIYFSNSDGFSTPLFYDFNLVPIVLTNSILLAPENIYSVLDSPSDNILLAVGDDQTNLVAIDQYQLIGNILIYLGSYPLLNGGLADIRKVVVLPNHDTITIDYSSKRITYNMTAPPQQIRGIFYDSAENDCNGYSDAIFRFNVNTNKKELVVVNGVRDTPVLQRYAFSDSSNSLSLQGSAPLTGFTYADLTPQFSLDRQSVVVSGIKQGIISSVQIRNANNLGDITFSSNYFDARDRKNLQAAGVVNGSIYIYTIDNLAQNDTNRIQIESKALSGGKVSTGSDLGDISLFSACSSCNFVAAIGTNSSKIALVNVNTGVTRATIIANCSVQRLSLSFDGTKLAYLCTNSSIFAYDTAKELNTLQGSGYSQVTSMYILANTDIVVVNNGIVSRVKIVNDQPRLLMQVKENVKANQNGSIAISNALQLYAYSPEHQTVLIESFSGNTNQTYTIDSNQEVVALAFSPDNTLVITTNDSTLIVLTPVPCPENSTQTGSQCVCNPTFLATGNSCQCGPFLSLQDGQCVCNDGQYFVSTSECADCSAMCNTCSDSGVTGCDSYSAVFVVIIVVIFLLLAGLGVVIFLKMQKTSKMDRIKSVARSHSKEQSDDLLVHEPLMKGEKSEK